MNKCGGINPFQQIGCRQGTMLFKANQRKTSEAKEGGYKN